MYKTAIKTLISTLLIWTSTIVIAGADGGSPTATDNQPGTINDPVITKSYLEQNIKQKITEELTKQTITEDKVKQMIATELAEFQPIPETPTTSNPPTPTLPPVIEAPNPSTSTGATSLTVIKLEPGQVLYGGAGAEIIVRTGKVAVISSDENGIPDVTSGKDIAAGATVELNHLLVFPREGRGIKSDAKVKQDIYIMVRGAYLITNADGSKVTS
ncbi:hypothetical protein [Paenibacillus agricola]|uniref:Uncharacterized protein n=1 Tax=Paenibacillus agricola TaxID=2716264 RepID=A0ABX0JGN1_9BACL|nr:hypothetical protein [Paenibacillus agricola]NHN33853.1 hypothetical protein [Paenibacillus agricola]